jgi:hypothetical protein
VDQEAPPERGLSAHSHFCRCNLFDRRSFDFGLLALFIGFVQEPIAMTPARCSWDFRLKRLTERTRSAMARFATAARARSVIGAQYPPLSR